MDLLVRPALKLFTSSYYAAIKKTVALFSILTMGLSISTAQQLQIRREVNIGGMQDDLGGQRVFINSKSQVVTFTVRDCDSCGLDEFRISIFDPQLRSLSWMQVSYDSRWYKTGGIAETADGGYIMNGSLSTAFYDDPAFDSDVQIAKVSSSGKLEWQKKYGGAGNEEAVGIHPTADGGYLLVVNTNGDNAVIKNATGKRQIWLAKLDVTGNTTWGKLLTTEHYNTATDFKKTKDGNYILSGSTVDSVTFGNNASRGDALLMKFNDQGTILWQSHIGGNADDEQFDKVTQDNAGNIFASGYTRSTNLGSQVNRGGSDGWITKVSNDGTVLSMRLIGGSADDRLNALAVSNTGLITTGGSTFSTDGDLIENVNKYTIWAVNFEEGSNNLRHGFFGHTVDNPSQIEDIAIDANTNIFCVATSGWGNVFMRFQGNETDGWLFSLGEPNLVKVAVYVDLNNNGKRDIDEILFNDGRLVVTQQSVPSRPQSITTSKGAFVANIDTGAYTLRFIPYRPYYTAVPSAGTINFSTFGMTDSLTIRLIPDAVRPDLEVILIPQSIARPGFDVSYTISVMNRGNKPAKNVEVKLVKDPRLTIVTTAPALSGSTGDTLVWTFASISATQVLNIQLTARLAAPPVTAIGDKLISQLSAQYQQEDETPFSSSFQLSELVSGSYDPNDKTELHGGLFPVNLLLKDKFLYLVRFQNTGTDTAFNISIRDTLDASLDMSGFEMLAASHPYTLSIKNGNQLEWKFNNVLLPDSNTNEKKSHGYLVFSVSPKSSLVVGDVITNQASIYFDYNLPIVTNTTSTQIVDLTVVLPKPVLAGLKPTYCGNEAAQAITVSNFITAGGASISGKLNGSLLSIDNSGKFSIDPTKLLNGNQNIEISFSKGGTTSTLTASFMVIAPVKPVVKLTSNVPAVNNGLTVLQFTATPTAGGGIAPLYTFSIHRGVSGNLQIDSSGPTLIMSSQLLGVGDNWIYVTMKSNDACVTSATAIDSVKIIRNEVTAIVDVNFPASIITAYPNPFKSELTIKGLQASGSYVVQLISAGGKLVKSQDVERRTSLTFYDLDVTKGVYFIRLYDKKKKRWLGSMQVLGLNKI